MEHKNKLTCSIKGHESYDIQFVCLQKICQQNDRFLCKRCCFLQHFKEHSENIICIEDLKEKYKVAPANEVLEQIFSQSKSYKQNQDVLQKIDEIYQILENNIKHQIHKMKDQLKKSILASLTNIKNTNTTISEIEARYNELSQQMLYIVDDFILGRYDKIEMERQMNEFVSNKDDLESKVKDMHRWVQFQNEQFKIIDEERLCEIQSEIVLKLNQIEKQLIQQLKLESLNYQHQASITQHFLDSENFWYPMIPAENNIFEQQNRPQIKFFKSNYGADLGLQQYIQEINLHKTFHFNFKSQKKQCQLHSECFRKTDKVILKIKISKDLFNFNFGVCAYEHKDLKYFKNLSGNQIDANDKTFNKNFLVIKDEIGPLKEVPELTYCIYINIEKNQFIIKDLDGKVCLSSDYNFLSDNQSEFWCFTIRTSCRSMNMEVLTAYYDK